MSDDDSKPQEMTTTKKVVIALAVLALVGAGVWLYMDMSKDKKRSIEPSYKFDFY